jgi:hypothetical protein
MGSGRDKSKNKVGERFLAVVYSVLARSDINDSEKLLLAHIWSYGAKGCWETNETMATMFNVTPRQVTTRVGRLKNAGCLLWLHGKNYHRTLWARQHPNVVKASVLPYRGQMILKESLYSGHNGTAPPGRNLPGNIEADFHVTRKDRCKPPGRNLPETKNTTRREITRSTGPPSAQTRAPALLEAQRQRAKEELDKKMRGLFKSVR